MFSHAGFRHTSGARGHCFNHMKKIEKDEKVYNHCMSARQCTSDLLLEMVGVCLLPVKLYWQSILLPSWPIFLSWKRHSALLCCDCAERQLGKDIHLNDWTDNCSETSFANRFLSDKIFKHMSCLIFRVRNPRSGRFFLMAAGQPDRVMGPQCVYWVWAGYGFCESFSRETWPGHSTGANSHGIAGFLEEKTVI